MPLTVEDLMMRRPISVSAGDRVGFARCKLQTQGVDSAPVLSSGRYVGFFCLEDATEGLDSESVESLIRPPRPAASPEESVESAMGRLPDRGRIPVLDGGELVGVTSVADLLAGYRADRMTRRFD